jgi:hypothetical protein
MSRSLATQPFLTRCGVPVITVFQNQVPNSKGRAVIHPEELPPESQTNYRPSRRPITARVTDQLPPARRGWPGGLKARPSGKKARFSRHDRWRRRRRRWRRLPALQRVSAGPDGDADRHESPAVHQARRRTQPAPAGHWQPMRALTP